MDSPLRRVWPVILLVAITHCRTIRYKLLTNEDGQRQLIKEGNTTNLSPDITFLERQLNLPTSSETSTNSDVIAQDRSDHELISTSASGIDRTSKEEAFKMINKWNDFTEKGWNRQKNAVYLNSTKLVIYDDGKNNRSQTYNFNEIKEGRSENLTDSENESESEWEILDVMASCFDGAEPKTANKLECLKTRILNIILGRFDPSMTKTGKSAGEKTLLHGKKLLKGALLPLLVLLVIKYLVALPVIAAGLLTIKTFWLSLLSAGVAAFSTPWKKRPTSYTRVEPGYDTPWGSVVQGGQTLPAGTEKYYM